MELVWSAHDAGLAGRKRAAKACSDCHRNKKRCHHSTSEASVLRKSAPAPEPEGSNEASAPVPEDGGVEREGDLVPKSILTDLSPSVDTIAATPTPGDCLENTTQSRILPCRQLSLQDPRSMLERFRYSSLKTHPYSGPRARYLQSVGAFDPLPKSTTDALVPIYVSLIDSCLPILDGRQFIGAYFTGRASNILVKAVCLIVCKLEEAKAFLRLQEAGPVLNSRDFSGQIYEALDAALDAEMEPDRIARIQTLILMHAHQGSNGLEESSRRLSQAIHDCHTLSLQYLEPGRNVADESNLMWWTIWTFDRVNACVGSRPMMLFNYNVITVKPPAEEYRCQTLHVWLRLSDLLEDVYRIYVPPGEQEEWTGDFPSFESICADVPVHSLQPSHSATFRVYYDMIAMLSCRAGHIGSPSYIRRSAAADELQRTVARINPTRLLPIPVIPYSISLALTVAYRDLRDGYKLPQTAIDDISSRCDFLETLGNDWPTASTMARLGRTVLSRSRQGTTAMAARNSAARATAIVSTGRLNHSEQQCPNTTSVGNHTLDNAGNDERDAVTGTGSMPMVGAIAERADAQSRPGHEVLPDFHDGTSGSVLYGDLDGIFGSMLDTSWINMSQDLIDFADLAEDMG